MSAKINNLSELYDVLCGKDKIESQMLHFAELFSLEYLLKKFGWLKQQGYTFLCVITKLITIRLGGMSIYGEMRTAAKTMDENTLYRLLNDGHVDWRHILSAFTRKFIRIVEKRTQAAGTALRCFVIDDTTLEKCGKTIEGISRVYDHVQNKYVLGFKMLLLGYYDGKMLIPADMSLHRENKNNSYGLRAEEQKRQYKSNMKKDSAGAQRQNELDAKKTAIVVEMLQRAVRNGMIASYALMDSWFTCEEVIKAVRNLKKGAMHVVGMCKMDARKFGIDGKELKSAAIVKMYENSGKIRTNKRYKSQYMVVDADYKGVPVRLFYIRYKRSINWTLLLSTDCSVNFNRVMEIYQIRWTIEVLFKECKQYLRLGKSQNTAFCGQIADASLALISYTILSLGKRFGSYETIGGLFETNRSRMLEKTMAERIMAVVLEIIILLLEFIALDVEDTMRLIVGSEYECEKLTILLNAVCQHDKHGLTNIKTAA